MASEIIDVAAPVSSRRLPCAERAPKLTLIFGVLSTGGFGSSAATGLGPMNGLFASVGPAAPAGVTVENRLNEAELSFKCRFTAGMPGSESDSGLNGLSGL